MRKQGGDDETRWFFFQIDSDYDCSVDLCDDDNDPTNSYEGSASDPCTP